MKEWSVVLVGCGGISSTWFQAIAAMPEVKIVGLIDLDIERARAQADKFQLGDVALGSDLEAMLTDLKPEVVFDCTVPPAHKTVVLTALKHGCHVLGEKPLADTVENARLMIQAAVDAGKQYGVMQNRRWLKGIRRVRHALDLGVIGNVHTLHSDFFLAPHFGGFREEMDHVLLLDMAIHSFDQARFILGAKPLSVLAGEWNPPGSWYRHGASAMAMFSCEEGKVATYRGSWCASGLETSWECSWRIIGEKGTLLWDGGDGFSAEVIDGDEGFIRPYRAVDIPEYSDLQEFAPGHEGAIRNFIESLNGKEELETPAHDNIHSLAMVQGAIASAEKGMRVNLADL